MEIHNKFRKLLAHVDEQKIIAPNFISISSETFAETQEQTADIFSKKWDKYNYKSPEFQKMVTFQKNWYLDLYGFSDEATLATYLNNCSVVLDAGAGKCYKAAWFAELSPSTTVLAADISNSLNQASEHYKHLTNLFFVQCDIANMSCFDDDLFDYVSCDQVIHHTTDPFKTFQELVRVTGLDKDLSIYVYRKKALPRELVDDYFREFCKALTHDELLELSRQITELGKILSFIDKEIDFPEIPALGIEGGKMTVQRFLYWNFLKCYWNEEQGYDNSVMTNYDWYSPSQAFRYSEEEFRKWIDDEQLHEIHFHKERACYSGRFRKLKMCQFE